MKPKEENVDNLSNICDFCLGDDQHNKYGSYEKMLICKDCDAKAHPSCMKYSASLAIKALSYPWQCIECKTCVVCLTASNDATILFCDGCDKAYHMTCHQPNLTEKPDGIWMCHSCSVDNNCINSDSVNGEASLNSNHLQDSARAAMSNSFSSNHRDIQQETKPNVLPPNLVDWSAEDVTDYFSKIGFPDQAPVFLREEIDGKSLLLLKRSDVIESLSFKLGPAVKIYDQIAKLQNANASNSTYNTFY